MYIQVLIFELFFLLSKYTVSLISDFNYNFSSVYRLFDIYEPEVCHFIDHEASLGNLSPLPDPSHPACEIIRGDTQWLKSNFL